MGAGALMALAAWPSISAAVPPVPTITLTRMSPDASPADMARPQVGRGANSTLSIPGGLVDRVPSLLYSATTQTGFRFNPGPGGVPDGSGVQQDVTMDDVPVANPGAAASISITQIQFGVRQIAGDPGTGVAFFATTLTGAGATQAELDAAIALPLTALGTIDLPAVAASQTTVVTLNYTTPLVIPLNNTFFTGGFGAFSLGLQFTGPNAAGGANVTHGWRMCFPDNGFVNADELFWVYDSDQAAPADRGAFTFGTPDGTTVPPSTYFLTVTGELTGGTATGSCCAVGQCCAVTVQSGCTGTWTLSGVCNPSPCGAAVNDECAGAIAATVGANPGNSCGATTSFTITPVAACGGFAGSGGSNDVWRSFTPATSGTYTIDLCNAIGYDTVMAVYDSCPADGTITPLACNDDLDIPCASNGFASGVTLALTAGTQYKIRIAGYGAADGPTGNYVLNIASTATGACCQAGTACAVLASAECTAQGGSLIPDAACSPDPCPGACCQADGSCVEVSATACAGTFQGAGVTCGLVTCPSTGACCCGSGCTLATAVACSGANQRFAGSGTACNAAGNFTTPCCKGDYNKSAAGNVVSVQDIFDFLSGYFSGSNCADTNASGAISVQDIFDFLSAYFTGC